MDKRIQIMENEKVSKILLKFGIPSIIGFIVNAIYNFVDALYMGNLGTSQMGAASVAFPIVMIIIGIGHIFGAGAAFYISRLLGEKKRDEAEKTLSVAFFSSLIIGAVISVITLLFMSNILIFLGATDSILPYAKNYATIYVSCSAIHIAAVTLSNAVRGQGAVGYSMMAMLIGAVSNIILDPILIFTMNLGIKGAAIATVISQTISVIILLGFYMGRKSYIRISLKKFTLSSKIFSEIFKIGTPQFLFQLLASMAIGVLNYLAGNYSDGAVAAIGIINRIMAIGMYVIFGYTKGFQPLAGFSYGAKQYGRLKEAINFSLKFTTIFCLIFTITVLLSSKAIVGWFSIDPEVITIGSKGLIISSLAFPLFGFQLVYTTLFLSIGKAREGGLLSLCRQGILFFPLVLILPAIFSLNGILAIQAVADTLTFFMTLLIALVFDKKMKKLMIYNKDKNGFEMKTGIEKA